MKLYFDINLVSGTRFGMTIATMELMKALKKEGVEVINFAAGRPKHLLNHIEYMKSEGFKVKICPIPRKILGFLNKFGLCIENLFLGRYDYFIQIGLHIKRNISQKKYLISIHDTVGLRYPKDEPPFPANSQKIINRSGKILTVSEFSKDEILHFFKCKRDKVQVIPNGCDLKRFKRYEQKIIEEIKTKYSLPEHYLIAYGGTSPRKNMDYLLKGYVKWHNEDKLPLVIFGQKMDREISGVIHLGYIPDEDVPIVISGAKALVFPTYYEGFGLPIFEAFACGIPVICSSIPSLTEVTSGNAIFFNPYQQEDLIEKLSSFETNTEKNKVLIERGLEIVSDCSWKKSAIQLKKLLETSI